MVVSERKQAIVAMVGLSAHDASPSHVLSSLRTFTTVIIKRLITHALLANELVPSWVDVPSGRQGL